MQSRTKGDFTEPLLDFIPRISPRLDRPTWMAPYVELIEQATTIATRVVVAGPPQHGKTECSVHGLVRAMVAMPDRRHGYATYNQKRAARVERKARVIAERAGLKLRFRRDDWINERTGGCIVWASRKGGLTGEPIDGILLIDDIIKDRREAESSAVLQECEDWFDEVAEPRCHASASIVVMMTRWSKRDLSGVLIGRAWPYVNLQALADGPIDDEGRVTTDPLHRRPGEPLCEARKTRLSLEQKRRTNIFSFVSLYQGEPRPRGGTLFKAPHYYDALPKEYRAGYGVDLSYTSKTSSDFSVCIEGWMTSARMPPDELHDNKAWVQHKLYIVDVKRAQVDAPSFTLTLKSKWSTRRGPMRWYCATSELGAGQFVKKNVPGFEFKLATADKFIRATPVAEAWNEGCVLVPSREALGLDPDDLEEPEPEWLTDFVDEVAAFTGVNDATDDQIDALAALWDTLITMPAGAGPTPMGGNRSRWDGVRGRGFG